MMMKLEEVGRVPKDRVAIQRMVVSTRPSSQFYQLSFHQCMLCFFLNQFLGTFRDFADDDDFLEKDIKSIKSSDRSSDSFSSNSELLVRWSFHQRRCVRMGPLSFPWMKRAQSHISGLFILNFVIIVIVFLLKTLFFYLLPTFHALLQLSMLHLLFLDFSP